MPTEEILQALHALEESPWGDLKGKALDSRGLALRLKKYAIKSKNVRIGRDILKGYSREDLFDAWSRDLQPSADGQDGSHSHKGATSATNVTGDVVVTRSDTVEEEV
jgi:hypothetical protein